MKNSYIDQLCQMIDPSCAGIIWITDSPLANWKKEILALDYFFDGLLMKEIFFSEHRENPPTSSPSRMKFFMTHNFNYPLFLGHINFEENGIVDDISSHLQMISSQIDFTRQKKVMILENGQSTLKKSVMETLKKEFPQLDFVIFPL